MKHSEFEPCLLCKKGVMHDGRITFYRVRLRRMGINVAAVQRQARLEAMLGGSVQAGRIANAMMDHDLAQQIGNEDSFIVCDACAISNCLPIGVLAELASDRQTTTGEASGAGTG